MTYITSSHDVTLNGDYNIWLDDLSQRYEHAKTRAAAKVNSEKLLWNWQMGRDLVMRKAEEQWGTGIVEQLSLDLQNKFPKETGFGSSNIWYMKKWYLFYSEKLQWPVGELLNIDTQQISKLQHIGLKTLDFDTSHGMPFPELFAYIPWGHHIEIITKCKTIEEASFYLHKTVENGWSRTALQQCIKANMYATQGGAVTNFSTMLAQPQSELAQEITKENYAFSFLTLPEGYNENQLEEALCEQMTRFLLELGKGFAFLGRQMELVVGGRPRRIDLLFYHIYLRCYIVVELKAVPFEPEFAGKINYYVSAVDDILKSDNDNPTIGLLICSNINTTDVQYAFRGVNTPIGVSTYSDVQIEEIKKHLPTVEQLQERIKLLEAELRKKK